MPLAFFNLGAQEMVILLALGVFLVVPALVVAYLVSRRGGGGGDNEG